MFGRDDEATLFDYLEELIKNWLIKNNLNLSFESYFKYSRQNLTKRL